VGRLNLAEEIASLRTPDELSELLDPDVMWYSTTVDSNFTCNDRDDVVACIQRVTEDGLSGRFEVLGSRPLVAVVERLMHFRHRPSLTRRTFPDSLVGNGEGGGGPAVCRVYIQRPSRA
jgi:hypothetical protein